MVKDTVYELEGYKAKVQETIDHVASGVTTLNEDQVEKAKDMLDALEEEFHEMKARTLEVLDRQRPVVVPLESRVKRFRAEGRMVEDPEGAYRLHADSSAPETIAEEDGYSTGAHVDGPARVDTYAYNPDGPAVLDVVEAGKLDADGQPIREETYTPGPEQAGTTYDHVPTGPVSSISPYAIETGPAYENPSAADLDAEAEKKDADETEPAA
jgi:hypothetical protein